MNPEWSCAYAAGKGAGAPTYNSKRGELIQNGQVRQPCSRSSRSGSASWNENGMGSPVWRLRSTMLARQTVSPSKSSPRIDRYRLSTPLARTVIAVIGTHRRIGGAKSSDVRAQRSVNQDFGTTVLQAPWCPPLRERRPPTRLHVRTARGRRRPCDAHAPLARQGEGGSAPRGSTRPRTRLHGDTPALLGVRSGRRHRDSAMQRRRCKAPFRPRRTAARARVRSHVRRRRVAAHPAARRRRAYRSACRPGDSVCPLPSSIHRTLHMTTSPAEPVACWVRTAGGLLCVPWHSLLCWVVGRHKCL